MVGLPDGEKTLEDMYNRLDSIPACDGHIDGQTNGQTSCHSIVRAMHTRRAVKTNVETLLGLMLKEKSARFRQWRRVGGARWCGRTGRPLRGGGTLS